MRRISWIAVIAVALLVVTAPTALSQPVELRFMTCGGGLENWTEAVAMWNERNPDVRVVHEHIPICWEPLYERIMVEYAAGTAPDVARMGLAFWPGLKENGMLYDIMPILERLGFDPGEYFPGIMEYERDGGMYGLSSSIYSLATVINEDHFHEVGLPLPSTDWASTWTHDEYREALRLLTRYNPDGSLVRAGTTLNLHPERIIQYFWQKGGSWFTPDGRRSAVNDEIGIATLEWLHEILHVDRSAITNSAGDGEFNTALTSVHVTGQWFRPADDISARVRPLPRDVGGPATPMFIDPYIVLATTNHPEEATRFLMFLISGEVAELFIQRRHIGVPMHRATVLNMLDSMFGNLPTEDKMVWIEAMDYTRRVPFTPNWTEIVQASTEELQNRFQAMSRKPEASGLRLFARKRPVKKKSAPRAERGAGEKVCRRRATLPPGFPGSTITAEGLNFRVRNGNGWVPLAMVTGNGERCVRFWLVPGGWHPDDCTVRMV